MAKKQDKVKNKQKLLILKSAVSECIRKSDMRVSGDAYIILSEEVERLCEEAVDRAKANGRKTVMGCDF